MFTIKIIKNTIEERPAGQEWKVIGKRDDGSDRFDYTPEIMKKKEVCQTIYEQTVENLDLKAVINAVNATE